MKALIAGCLALGLIPLAVADEEVESGFLGLRISAGYQLGINLKSKFKTRLPGAGTTRERAYAAASGNSFRDEKSAWLSDDGGFIVKDDGSGRTDSTVNWRLPKSARQADEGEYAVFEMRNSYSDGVEFGKNDDSVMHGASVELAFTIARDGDWGMDLFVGFGWMRGLKCFDASGTSAGGNGEYRTRVKVDRNLLDHAPTSQYYSAGSGYGWGNLAELGAGPDLYLTDIGTPVDVAGSTASYSATGDFDEYDLYGGVKIWYEDEEYKWFRTTATIGVGVSYSEFDFAMNALSGEGASVHESFKDDDWDVYGLLGLGFAVTYWDIDFSFDALWRYSQSAQKIRSQYVNGEIDRPDFFFRVAMGYNF